MWILVLTFLFSCLSAEERALGDIKYYVDALNIEGGRISKEYLREDQIWVNLCTVLDRPFEDGKEWDDLNKESPFTLKEAAIEDYNEAQVNYAHANVLNYYIQHAKEITGKQECTILVQVHRNSSGAFQCKDLKAMLYFIPQNPGVKVNFCNGVWPKSSYDADIVISFSLVAGFNPEWTTSSLLVPDTFVPVTLKGIHLKDEYTIVNHLKIVLPQLVAEQNEETLGQINTYHRSLSAHKQKLLAKKLELADFKFAKIIQVDGMFNPSKQHPTFEVDNNFLPLGR